MAITRNGGRRAGLALAAAVAGALALLPAAPEAATGHDHGNPDAAAPAGGRDDAAPAEPGAGDGGPSADVLLGGGLLIGLGGGALVGWAVSRGRHRADPADDVEGDQPEGEPSTREQPDGERPAAGVRGEPVGSR
ncbi:hypothetical protein ABZ807_02575 [Micromonospora sp. NPDC047548]|uniref:hypothetical protein n=1 Tax=Micromonospora sp. NPDC047548 TaxID=3155624 RepID=UPI0033D4FF4C